jgi:hypothetical protein
VPKRGAHGLSIPHGATGGRVRCGAC